MARADWKRPEKFSAREGYKRIGLIVSYDGSAFSGWQIQKDEVTVQGEILNAVKKLTLCDDVCVVGSGRTDSGVHAMGQAAHIELPETVSLPVAAYHRGLNAFLPDKIRIVKSFEVDSSFHARFSSMAREYRYFFNLKSESNPFTSMYLCPVREFPDSDLLNGYASVVYGTHDFTTFSSVQDLSQSKYRDIYLSHFSYENGIFGEQVLCYKICGNAFLYHMVRSLAGTMIDYGLKGLSVDEFREILEGKNRALCGPVAPPNALYLWRVSYDPDEFMWFENKNRHENTLGNKKTGETGK